MKEKILLVGGGGHCHSVIDVIEQEGRYQILGIVDKKELIGQSVLDYKVIGCDDDLLTLFSECPNAIVTVGQLESSALRVKLFNILKDIGYRLPVIVSPMAYVSRYAEIGEGSIVMHQVMVNANAKIGVNCIINSKALVEHDAIVEGHCHISTAAVVNGGAVVRKNTFVGSNATSKQYIEIDGFVRAGSLIK